MALAVAYGKIDLNQALERMAQKERVNKLMRAHDLSRALATQVSIGHADLDVVLSRRRLSQHREVNRTRTCLEVGRSMDIVLLERKPLRGEVVSVGAYTFVFQHGEAEEFHKLQAKYAHASSDWKRVRKAFRVDKAVKALGKQPAKRPQERYSCSDKRLFSYCDRGHGVTATLTDGDMVRGVVLWFSRYEFGLEVKGGVEITVFRHALHDIRVT
jgi:sRNA-binding regulator protein Hfq